MFLSLLRTFTAHGYWFSRAERTGILGCNNIIRICPGLQSAPDRYDTWRRFRETDKIRRKIIETGQNDCRIAPCWSRFLDTHHNLVI